MRILHISHTLGCAGRKNSTTSIGCHGHAGGTRPDQTRKTPKDLSAHEIEERGHGESVGLYAVYMHERGGWGRGGRAHFHKNFLFLFKDARTGQMVRRTKNVRESARTLARNSWCRQAIGLNTLEQNKLK